MLEGTSGKKGVVYIAFGERYVAEAAHSARSLKTFNPEIPVTLFTDTEAAHACFDEVRTISPAHRRAKVDIIYGSPYEYTLYLDSDTEILMPIDDIFEVLERFDIAAAHDHKRKGHRVSAAIKEYAEIPYAFSEINCGVLAFRKNPRTEELFETWRQVFYENQAASGGLDQPSFRVALWRSQVRPCILPPEYNVRSKKVKRKVTNLSRNEADKDLLRPRIYHWHGLQKTARFFDALRKRRKAMDF
jgi:hypothetical protein